MSLFIVDVEADGPAPGIYSMVCFGVIKVQRDLENAPTFYGKTAPLNSGVFNGVNDYMPDALAVSGFTREEHLTFPHFLHAMINFRDWLRVHHKMDNWSSRPTFVSDNPAFDWQWINYYFWRSLNENPFGHSARRIGDFYAGLEGKWGGASNWKKLRRTKHTHNPVDDARGNAEALLTMCDAREIRLPGVLPLKERI